MKNATRLVLGLWCSAGFTFSINQIADAADFSCSSGDVACLISSINEANTTGGVNTINLDPGSYTLTSVNNVQHGANGLPLIASELTINGADAATTIIERDPSSPVFRIFDVAADGSLTLNGLTVRRGVSFGPGGGIANSGSLNISYSIVERNQAQFGAGIYNGGTLNVTHTILARNSAGFDGGGILNSGTGVITNVSIVANGLAAAGGASTIPISER